MVNFDKFLQQRKVSKMGRIDVPMVQVLPQPTGEAARFAGLQAAEKNDEEFRNYVDSERQAIVEKTYHVMHANQTVEFVRSRHQKWFQFNHGEYTLFEVIALLDQLVDDSDPDTSLPNSIHDLQTAERIRKAYPDHDWFHLVGLIHDVGKVLALWGEEQWASVGDTFPVGCKFAEEIVFSYQFQDNPDNSDPRYNTEYGIYKPNCGIRNLLMSFGHDEYMYQVLKHNTCTIPEEGLACIRFHSFYPWHQKSAYTQFMEAGDENLLMWVKEFNKFDLYSKSDHIPDFKALQPYYEGLLQKYGLAGKLKF